jgi:hypothetical protein
MTGVTTAAIGETAVAMIEVPDQTGAVVETAHVAAETTVVEAEMANVVVEKSNVAVETTGAVVERAHVAVETANAEAIVVAVGMTDAVETTAAKAK